MTRTAPVDGRVGDVGGQKTLRTYWKNYFERTDTVSADISSGGAREARRG